VCTRDDQAAADPACAGPRRAAIPKPASTATYSTQQPCCARSARMLRKWLCFAVFTFPRPSLSPPAMRSRCAAAPMSRALTPPARPDAAPPSESQPPQPLTAPNSRAAPKAHLHCTLIVYHIAQKCQGPAHKSMTHVGATLALMPGSRGIRWARSPHSCLGPIYNLNPYRRVGRRGRGVAAARRAAPPWRPPAETWPWGRAARIPRGRHSPPLPEKGPMHAHPPCRQPRGLLRPTPLRGRRDPPALPTAWGLLRASAPAASAPTPCPPLFPSATPRGCDPPQGNEQHRRLGRFGMGKGGRSSC